MALHTLTDAGDLGWICPGCNKEQEAHVSHELVTVHHMPDVPTHHRMVALPVCACGTVTYLKTDFTDQELQAPNMIDPETNQPTASHATAHRHMKLLQHMQKAGKPITSAEQTAQKAKK